MPAAPSRRRRRHLPPCGPSSRTAPRTGSCGPVHTRHAPSPAHCPNTFRCPCPAPPHQPVAGGAVKGQVHTLALVGVEGRVALHGVGDVVALVGRGACAQWGGAGRPASGRGACPARRGRGAGPHKAARPGGTVHRLAGHVHPRHAPRSVKGRTVKGRGRGLVLVGLVVVALRHGVREVLASIGGGACGSSSSSGIAC